MYKFFKKFIAVSKVLMGPELFLARSDRGMWLTLETGFKQIPDAIFLQLISEVHNI
jgi:hypothetical protein